MFQVIYEEAKTWPSEGPLFVEAPAISTMVEISPDVARRHVNDYLTMYVSMTLHAVEPVLFLGAQPLWRLVLEMRLRKLEPMARLGSIDVNATTGEVIPLSAQQIRQIQDRANWIEHNYRFAVITLERL
jgi:hypothetical protein